MRRLGLLIFVVLAAASVAMAQRRALNVPAYNAGADELGAHNGYGRGCVMCHAPHGGSFGNGTGATGANADPFNGYTALWGENLAPYYSKTFVFTPPGRSTYSVTLPAAGNLVTTSGTESVVLLCLSCHDGNIARVSMMQNSTVEQLPIVGGNAPTLFGLTPGNSGQSYNNEHPVGPIAYVQCNSATYTYSWDCTGGGATMQPIQMNGYASAQFLVNNPSSFWNGATYTACSTTGGTPACPTGNTWGYTVSGNPLSTPAAGTNVNSVTCTSCHDQHHETVWTVNGTNYATMFFIKGYYQPTTGGNSVAQFCRNCHGDPSNEMSGIRNLTTN